MAWFLNHYKCACCGRDWTDEWSCMCDDDCPHCGARHMSPHKSDELTGIIERRGKSFVVLWSPKSAEHAPDCDEVASFKTEARAKGYIASRLATEYRDLQTSADQRPTPLQGE